jgi:hypothetical protein
MTINNFKLAFLKFETTVTNFNCWKKLCLSKRPFYFWTHPTAWCLYWWVCIAMMAFKTNLSNLHITYICTIQSMSFPPCLSKASVLSSFQARELWGRISMPSLLFSLYKYFSTFSSTFMSACFLFETIGKTNVLVNVLVLWSKRFLYHGLNHMLYSSSA